MRGDERFDPFRISSFSQATMQGSLKRLVIRKMGCPVGIFARFNAYSPEREDVGIFGCCPAVLMPLWSRRLEGAPMNSEPVAIGLCHLSAKSLLKQSPLRRRSPIIHFGTSHQPSCQRPQTPRACLPTLQLLWIAELTWILAQVPL